ncbi:MAG: hypothetical protein ACI857_000224 [Arenicella sp.]|jgi:hypothetical protein
MLAFKLFSIIIFTSALLGCNKYIKDDYPDEQACERFAGEYNMYDSINNSNYNMNVSCIYTDGIISNADTLHYKNFANLFSFSYNCYFSLEPDGLISGTGIQPLLDKNGNSWVFSNGTFPSIDERRNVLIGDSLHLKFHINNTAYYVDEGVPYQDIETTHRGVKIH